jgi:dihydroorotase
MRIQIENGRVIDPANGLDRRADVFIADGVVAAIGSAPAGFEAEGTIDASGCIVCPGLVDLSARLREPGFEYRATLESEMAAAAAGGVTSLACPPDTDPPLDEPGLVEMLKHRARLPEFAHVYPVGALTEKLAGKRLTEMAELNEAGCVGFGQANIAVLDTQVLLRAMQYAATFGFSVWLQPQDPHLAKGGVAHDGAVAARLGLTGIPVVAETIALATLLHLARETGVHLHVTRLSSAAGLEMIRAARAAGVAVTCDVAAHHLHLSENDIGWFDPHCRLDPPLRSDDDRDALFADAEPGATGLELLLPLTLQWATEMRLPLATALARITSEPARIMGIAAGTLAPGAAADICIFDPNATMAVNRQTLKSQGKNTPLLGREFKGRVRYTLIEGHLAYHDEMG